jgi:hypothetical protein
LPVVARLRRLLFCLPHSVKTFRRRVPHKMLTLRQATPYKSEKLRPARLGKQGCRAAGETLKKNNPQVFFVT